MRNPKQDGSQYERGKWDREMERLNQVSNANRPEGYNVPATSETSHTPTPWQPNSVFINNEPNRMMIKQKGWKGDIIADLGEDTALSDANAKFIVNAVNNHDSFRELLGRCHSWISDNSQKSVDEPLAREVYDAIMKAEKGA